LDICFHDRHGLKIANTLQQGVKLAAPAHEAQLLNAAQQKFSAAYCSFLF
jgi:hypothetical protein